MKTAMGVFLATLALTATALGQNMTSFYAITGFRLPALRSGQFELTVTPHYAVHPSDYASSTAGLSSTPSSTSLSNSLTSYYTPNSSFTASTSFMYGFTDQTTMSFGVSYMPLHTYGVRTTLSSSGSDVTPSLAQTNSSSNGTTYFQDESVASTLTIAHRLEPNVELSVSASWSFSKSPYSALSSGSTLRDSGGQSPTFSTTNSSSNSLVSSNGHAFDISATLVVLGN